MNIDQLTVGEVKQLKAMFGSSMSDEPLCEAGKSYFIRTVTHHYTGRCVKCTPIFIELHDAAWIADDGRFHDFLKTGNANEVEPYVNPIRIPIGGILDVTEWHLALPLPREQK